MAVDVTKGELVAAADHPTTVDSDVLDGLDAAVAALGGRFRDAPLRVCSSAGGGLRLAVVGYESLVTAEAGHRVGLSAGAKVVHVAAGQLDTAAVTALREARPDIVLLVGGTDGGDDEALRHNAAKLARSRLRTPIVLAGNAHARDDLTALLGTRGRRVLPAENVLPRIGELNPVDARAAIREVFLRHVIGGKKLSRGRRFGNLVRGATPDVVLTAVELLADGPGPSNVVVVDVGGATTDVYSVLTPDAERDGRGGRGRDGKPARPRRGRLPVRRRRAARRTAGPGAGRRRGHRHRPAAGAAGDHDRVAATCPGRADRPRHRAAPRRQGPAAGDARGGIRGSAATPRGRTRDPVTACRRHRPRRRLAAADRSALRRRPPVRTGRRGPARRRSSRCGAYVVGPRIRYAGRQVATRQARHAGPMGQFSTRLGRFG